MSRQPLHNQLLCIQPIPSAPFSASDSASSSVPSLVLSELLQKGEELTLRLQRLEQRRQELRQERLNEILQRCQHSLKQLQEQSIQITQLHAELQALQAPERDLQDAQRLRRDLDETLSQVSSLTQNIEALFRGELSSTQTQELLQNVFLTEEISSSQGQHVLPTEDVSSSQGQHVLLTEEPTEEHTQEHTQEALPSNKTKDTAILQTSTESTTREPLEQYNPLHAQAVDQAYKARDEQMCEEERLRRLEQKVQKATLRINLRIHETRDRAGFRCAANELIQAQHQFPAQTWNRLGNALAQKARILGIEKEEWNGFVPLLSFANKANLPEPAAPKFSKSQEIELTSLIARLKDLAFTLDPNEGSEHTDRQGFLEDLTKLLQHPASSPSDPRLLDIVAPFQAWIAQGKSFRSLRKHLSHREVASALLPKTVSSSENTPPPFLLPNTNDATSEEKGLESTAEKDRDSQGGDVVEPIFCQKSRKILKKRKKEQKKQAKQDKKKQRLLESLLSSKPETEIPEGPSPQEMSHEEILVCLQPLLCGKRAAMIGGDPRESRRQNLEAILGLQHLDWVQSESSSGARSAQDLAQRLQCGKVDLLILLLDFCGHPKANALIDAAKKNNIPFVPVLHGYGESRILQALLRTLAKN